MTATSDETILSLKMSGITVVTSDYLFFDVLAALLSVY